MSDGYYQFTKKEGDFIIRLIELSLEYPEEARSSLVAVKERFAIGFKDSLRHGRRSFSEEDKEKARIRMKEIWKTKSDVKESISVPQKAVQKEKGK